MDLVILGVYSFKDKTRLNSLVSDMEDLEIVWDYEQYNVEASGGIITLSKAYNLADTGVLIKKNGDSSFTSYPLIYEVTESILEGKDDPSLFQFFHALKKADISKMILAFADEWDQNTLVKVERRSIDAVIDRLNSIFVWCETYVNLISGSEMRGDDHPLVLEVDFPNI